MRAAPSTLAVIPHQYGRPHGHGHPPDLTADRTADRAAGPRSGPSGKPSGVGGGAALHRGGSALRRRRVLTRRVAWRVRERHGRPTPRPRRHLHPKSRGRSSRTAPRCAQCRAAPRRVGHVPCTGLRELGGAGATEKSDHPRCSNARCACWHRCSRAAATSRCSPSTSPPRSNGPRRRMIGPRSLPSARPPATQSHPMARERPSQPCTSATSSGSGTPGWSTSTTCFCCRPNCARDRRVRRRHPVAVPPPLRRRVPRRQPAAVRLLAGCAAGAPTCVVGDPHQAHLQLERCRRQPCSRSSHQHFPVQPSCGSTTTTARRPEILGRRQRSWVMTRGFHANRPTGAAPTVTCHPSDRDEAQATRAPCVPGTPVSPGRSKPCSRRTNAQLVLFEEAFRSAQVPYRVRGRGSFLDQPEIRQALIELRRQPATTPLLSAIVDIDELFVRPRHRRASPRARSPRAPGRRARPARARRHRRELRRLARRHRARRSARSGRRLGHLVHVPHGQGSGTARRVPPRARAGFVPIGHADSPAARTRAPLFLRSRSHGPSASCTARGRSDARSDRGLTPGRPLPGWTRWRPRSAPSPTAATAPIGVATSAQDEPRSGRQRAFRPPRQARRRRPRRPGRLPGAEDVALGHRTRFGRSTFVIFHDTTLAAVAEAKPHEPHVAPRPARHRSGEGGSLRRHVAGGGGRARPA